MQWRKLFGFEPSHAIYCNKLATRDFIAANGFGHCLTQLIWTGEDLDASPLRSLTFPFVLKSNHGSNLYIVVRDPTGVDYDDVGREAREWLRLDYGDLMSEPGYFRLPRRLMIERMILTEDGSRPREHRILVFHGKAQIVISEIPTDEHYGSCSQFHTADWERLHWQGLYPLYEPDLARPVQLGAMIAVAEQLVGPDDHLRVDFYEDGSDFKIGEITTYSYSGLVKFMPRTADSELGALWSIRHPLRRALAKIASGTWAECEFGASSVRSKYDLKPEESPTLTS
ncbi:MAG: ATP-grasp fold amidoligase family protein [Methylovirgula sp.]